MLHIKSKLIHSERIDSSLLLFAVYQGVRINPVPALCNGGEVRKCKVSSGIRVKEYASIGKLNSSDRVPEFRQFNGVL